MAAPYLADYQFEDMLAHSERLRPLEWLWVHNYLMAFVLYAVATLVCVEFADFGAPEVNLLRACAAIGVVGFGLAAVLHPVCMIMARFDGGCGTLSWAGRRRKAIATRPLRHDKTITTLPVANNVYLARVRKHERGVPHLWPLSLGYGAEHLDIKGFDAVEEVEEAMDYKQQLLAAHQRELPGGESQHLSRLLQQ